MVTTVTGRIEGHIEFDEACFPRHAAEQIEARIIEDVTRMVGAVGLCPYCRGRGDFEARLVHDHGTPTIMRALCGQCMGTGERDAADAEDMIERILAGVRSAIAREGRISDGPGRALGESTPAYDAGDLEAEWLFWAEMDDDGVDIEDIEAVMLSYDEREDPDNEPF